MAPYKAAAQVTGIVGIGVVGVLGIAAVNMFAIPIVGDLVGQGRATVGRIPGRHIGDG